MILEFADRYAQLKDTADFLEMKISKSEQLDIVSEEFFTNLHVVNGSWYVRYTHKMDNKYWLEFDPRTQTLDCSKKIENMFLEYKTFHGVRRQVIRMMAKHQKLFNVKIVHFREETPF